ncbi:MAG: hypothetical protein KDC48_24560, partial [Planctomycetes bacterium]|nr:hypothetical protein [Planctomycetota bacterium]
RGFVDPARASAPLEFTVSVAAPFWRRPATLAAVAVAAVVLLAVGARVRRRHRAALSRLEAQVRHVQRLESLGVLAGGIAHDFNNLLTTMLGHAELVEQQLPPGHAARQNLGPIRAAATQAGKLTRQMLDYAGKGSGMREVVDLRQVLADMESLLRASVPRWIRLEVRSGAAPILVHG